MKYAKNKKFPSRTICNVVVYSSKPNPNSCSMTLFKGSCSWLSWKQNPTIFSDMISTNVVFICHFAGILFAFTYSSFIVPFITLTTLHLLAILKLTEYSSLWRRNTLHSGVSFSEVVPLKMAIVRNQEKLPWLQWSTRPGILSITAVWCLF